jgi:hypothetical protein
MALVRVKRSPIRVSINAVYGGAAYLEQRHDGGFATSIAKRGLSRLTDLSQYPSVSPAHEASAARSALSLSPYSAQ